MSLTPAYFSSEDPGAPALNGTAGSLTDLLDAVLVDGYGSGPGFKASLGWARESTESNKRVYRNSDLYGTGYRLHVDDSASAGDARTAWLRGYKAMNGPDTGSNPTPTVSQRPNGAMWIKSSQLTSVSRRWWAIGNATVLYIFIDVHGTGNMVPMVVGDYKSILVNDPDSFFVSDSRLASFTGSATAIHSYVFWSSNSFSASIYSASDLDSVGSVGMDSEHVSAVSNGALGSNIFPDNLVSRNLLLRDVLLCAPSRPRGMFPGVLAPYANSPFEDLEVVERVAALGGSSIIAKSFRTFTMNNAAAAGQVVFLIGERW